MDQHEERLAAEPRGESDPTEDSVRIEESAAKPNDAGRWGESRVALTLAEV